MEGLVDSAVAAIEEVVHRETRAWNTKDLDLLLSVFHPDMVWPWPPHKDAHDPVEWVIPWGRYNEERWRAGWGELFETDPRPRTGSRKPGFDLAVRRGDDL